MTRDDFQAELRPMLSLALPVRILIASAALVPVGFLMGTMFPRGLAHLEATSPELVPWAWAINGTLSVVSAVAAALAALSWGFTVVIWMGAACYGVCIPLTRRGASRPA